MSFRQEHCLKLGLGCLVWLGWLTVPAAAQTSNSAAPTPAQETPLTREVVNELQQLRQAVERSNLNQSRVAIAIERLRLQQELLTHLNRDLESAQRSVLEHQATRLWMAERLKDLEQTINNATDPQHRKALEEEQKKFKAQYGSHEQFEQSAQARETELRTRVAAELSRLNELNDRLDALERELERQAVTSTAPKERKRD
jgi:vacuolar-type H+-ATPase subunit I/STV1